MQQFFKKSDKQEIEMCLCRVQGDHVKHILEKERKSIQSRKR